MGNIKLIKDNGALLTDPTLTEHASQSNMFIIISMIPDSEKYEEIGYISMHETDQQELFIEDVCIEEVKYRSRGIGKTLIKNLQKKYSKISLYSTESAEGFWTKVGFKKADVIDHHQQFVWERKC